jgi:competence protein ComEC
VIVLLNASLPTYGVIANLLAAPAAPVATVVGLVACVLLALVPPLGAALCQLAWLPSAWIAAVAQFFSVLPGAQLPWLTGAAGVALLIAVTVLVLLAVFGRRWALGALVLAVVVYLGFVGGSRTLELLGRPADWQIAACDIGQGDAVFVRSEGKLALIDTGPKPERLTACMSELGINHIDLLVLTHYDLDHVGGAAAVVGRVDRVFVGPTADSADELLHADFAAAGAEVEQVSRGPTGLLGDLRWKVLWPPSRLVGLDPGNPSSVTLEFEPVGACAKGCLSSIFLGDLGHDSQERLLRAGPVDTVDVVKVAHHGSADQSERLYRALRAVVGVIGVGKDNGYGHPTDELLDILARAGTAPARTDEGGLILLAPGDTPGTVRVWTQH